MALMAPAGFRARLLGAARSLCPGACPVNGWGDISRLAPGATPLFAFYFSGLDFAEGRRLLAGIAARRPVLVADFCLAERNLTLLPAALARLAFAGRRAFWAHGALEGLCADLPVAARLSLLCGAATLALLGQSRP